MADSHANFAYSTVATAPSPATSGTSLVVASGDGAKFPAVPFNATIWPISTQPTAANAEIVRVTAISTDTLTITRAQESSSARTVIVGDQIAATITVKTLTDAEWGVNNFSTAAQTLTAATLTQITGSSIAVPANKLRIGTIFQWTIDIVKTAAGTALSTYHVRIGTANSTADTAILTFTKPAGTAAIDTGFITITAIVRGPLSASCIMAGTFVMTHNLSTTGHATIPCVAVNVVSSAFDATVANLFVSVSSTTGASDAITIQCVTAEATNL